MQINYSTEKYTPYGGLIIIDRVLKKNGIHQLINEHLGSRGAFTLYSYADVLMGLYYSQLSNGSAVEDIHELKQKHLTQSFAVCSSDTVLNTIKDLAFCNEAHLTEQGNLMEINHHPVLNNLLFSVAIKTKLLVPGIAYCIDMDTSIVTNEKYDANYAYTKELGYNPLVAAVGAIPIYIEGRSGNTSPAYGLPDAIKKIHRQFIQRGLTLGKIRIDAAGYQTDIIDYCNANHITFYIRAKSSQALDDAIADTVEWMPVKGCIHKTEIAQTWLDINNKGILHKVAVSRRVNKKYENTLLQDVGPYTYYAIITNDEDQSNETIYTFYNGRGASEQNNDSLKNEFNWKHLPFSFLHQNTAFMIITAMGKVLFEYLKKLTHQHIPNLIHSTGMELKSFINKFVSVVGKWISHGRQRILKLYSNTPYHLLLE
jgi:hypothetical protein